MTLSQEQLKQLSVPERLGRVARQWQSVADRELAPLGLTYPRWSAMWKLVRIGDGASQKQLAEALEIELASLMRTLTQLEQQSLVVRRVCPDDGRAKRVYLTDTGHALVKKMEAKILKVRRTLMADIADEDIETVKHVLAIISRNAHQMCSEQKKHDDKQGGDTQ